jgi:hypothetical protein
MTTGPGRRATVSPTAGNVLSMRNGDAHTTLHEPGRQLLLAQSRPPWPAAEPDDAALARAAAEAYRAWSAAGRPGAVSQAEARRLLLGDPG